MSCPNCSSRNGTASRRLARFAGVAIPGILLALMPKCPACVAAYVAAFTGLGISLTAASQIRTVAIVVCALALVAVAGSLVFRISALRNRSQH